MFIGESPKITYAQQSCQTFSKHITALDFWKRSFCYTSTVVLGFHSFQNAMKANLWNFISKLMLMAQLLPGNQEEYVTREKDVQQQRQW